MGDVFAKPSAECAQNKADIERAPVLETLYSVCLNVLSGLGTYVLKYSMMSIAISNGFHLVIDFVHMIRHNELLCPLNELYTSSSVPILTRETITTL